MTSPRRIENDPASMTRAEVAPEHPGDGHSERVAGYRGPAACAAAGITYRVLDYWARIGLIGPSLQDAETSQRLYSGADIVLLRIAKRLLDTGVSLQDIQIVADHLRSRNVDELIGVTLFSDGKTVYECTSPEEIVEILQGGQGVFGISVGGTIKEIDGALRDYHPYSQSEVAASRHRR